MYDIILVPTDGSEGAIAAANHALGLARTFDSTVRFLSVVDERSYRGLAGLDSATDEQREALEEQAADALETLDALASEAAVESHTTIEYGTPHETIRSEAATHDAGLIVMGTHGRTGLERALVGSVTERVVRTSDVPVLTVQRDLDDGYDAILLPTDGSDTAAAAVEHGLTVAERYDATIHALSVVDLGTVGGSYDIAPMLDAWTERCERAVEEIATAGAERGVDVRTHVAQGTPRREIEAYIEREGIDLVTMGTHGRTGLERALVGSVTARIVRSSPVPVLTVR